MNVHEYQGKEILASYGVRIQRGHVANNAEEAVEKADIVVLLVAHDEFKKLNINNSKIVLDFCGVLN
mgnify:CR=1 FL=1